MTLSKGVLRAYYEACFDGRELARYHGVSFEQYVALMQLKYPSISPWGAVSLAASNNRGDLAKHAADFPPDTPYSVLGRFDELEESHSVRRLTKKDSNLSPGKKAWPGCLLGIKVSVTGWSSLANHETLHLELGGCKTDEDGPFRAKKGGLEELVMSDCSDGCVWGVFANTSPVNVAIVHSAPFDLALLANDARLESLSVSSPLVLVPADAKWPKLKKLVLARLELDPRTSSLLERHASRLEVLDLFTSKPVGPEALPPLPKLRSLSFPRFQAHREAWLEYAVESRAHVSFSYPDDRKSVTSELSPPGYMLRYGAGKSAKYEARGTMLSGSLVALARLAKAKRDVAWSIAGGIWSAKSPRRQACEEALARVAIL